jgi:hypothetical protein
LTAAPRLALRRLSTPLYDFHPQALWTTRFPERAARRKIAGVFFTTPVDSRATPVAQAVIHTLIRVPSTSAVDNHHRVGAGNESGVAK